MALLSLGLPGCAKKDHRPRKPFVRKGTLKSVDLQKKYARIETIDRRGDKLEMDGSFTDQTIVTIDGRPARIDDVRPGDAVEITATLQGKGINAELIATRVDVSRASATSSAPAGR